jgi:hypothetical protein
MYYFLSHLLITKDIKKENIGGSFIQTRQFCVGVGATLFVLNKISI